eukprot:c40122_g1_i1 orf=73-2301(+)
MSYAALWNREHLLSTKYGFKRLCEHGRLCDALHAVDAMAQQGLPIPNSFFYHLLQSCVIKKDLDAGRQVHHLISLHGLQHSSFLGNHLIRMYDACGCFAEANRVFLDLIQPDVFAWTSLLSAHAKLGHFTQACEWYRRMLQSEIEPDGHTFVAVLGACISAAAVIEGMLIHAHIVEIASELNVFVTSTLIQMYATCGSLKDAYAVFVAMPNQNVVAWSMMVSGFAQHGHALDALQYYKQMQVEGIMADNVTFMSVLKACASIGSMENSKLIHVQIVDSYVGSDVCVINTLIDLYAKCGSLALSCKVFKHSPAKDLVTWSVMIAAYVQHGCAQEALQLFYGMHFEGMKADRVTILSTLKACSSVAALRQGRLIQSLVIESGLEFDTAISNTLIDVYMNCKGLEDACSLFNSMQKCDTVTWTIMIAGYSQLEQGPDAISLFNDLRKEHARPDMVAFLSTLKVCSNVAALQDGKLIHHDIIDNGFNGDIAINNTLIDMYSNCQSLEDARRVFGIMPKQDVVTWNAIIAGCFRCNDHRLGWHYYDCMQQEGMKPDGVTYINLLSVCSYRGQLTKCYNLLESMKEQHGIEPTDDHFNCIADLLGRIGCVNEAEGVLRSATLGLNIVGWTSLLSHCKTHSNVEVGKRCFEHVVMLDPKNSKGYLLMSLIYVNAGRLKDAEMLERLRLCANAWKKPGDAFVEISNRMHGFSVGEDEHPQVDDVNKKLMEMSVRMQQGGYMPCLDLSISS